jgi:hypothetical protein
MRVRARRDDDGEEYWGHGHAFRVRRVGPRRFHLVYLRKTPSFRGAQVLECAERFVRTELGGSTLQLQDASFVSCTRSQDYDLGFRSLLRHGLTWYERLGYSPEGLPASRRRAAVIKHMKLYSSLPVDALGSAIEKQVSDLQSGAAWRPTSPRLFNASLRTVSGVPASREQVLRARRGLLRLVKSASVGARLGPWLSSLDCSDYAHFMTAMYGDWRGEQNRNVAVAAVAKTVTPTIREFEAANALRRFSHRTTWVKQVTADSGLRTADLRTCGQRTADSGLRTAD